MANLGPLLECNKFAQFFKIKFVLDRECLPKLRESHLLSRFFNHSGILLLSLVVYWHLSLLNIFELANDRHIVKLVKVCPKLLFSSTLFDNFKQKYTFVTCQMHNFNQYWFRLCKLKEKKIQDFFIDTLSLFTQRNLQESLLKWIYVILWLRRMCGHLFRLRRKM